MWSDKKIYILLQEGNVSSVHDSEESAMEHRDAMSEYSRAMTRIDGPWIVHVPSTPSPTEGAGSVQSCEAANQRSLEPGNTEPARGGLDLLASGRAKTGLALDVERNQRPFTFRLHEDSVEIACCLFNKGMLSGDNIDDASEEIEAWMTALAAAAPEQGGVQRVRDRLWAEARKGPEFAWLGALGDALSRVAGAQPSVIHEYLEAAVYLADVNEVPAKVTVERWRAALSGSVAPAVQVSGTTGPAKDGEAK
jgi:hypothetical protein